MRAGLVSASDWNPIKTQYQEAVADAQDPGRADLSRCADASAPGVQLLGEKERAVELSSGHCGDANYHEGDPWHYILGQTVALRQWVGA